MRIVRSIVLSGNQDQFLSRTQNKLSTTGNTTKKTINKTIVIGVALTATVILAPATFARDHHEPPRPSNGIQLAADIVNLVRAVIEPRPAPVIVEAPPKVVEKTVVVTTPGAVAIPEYDYVLYEDEYIPYYEGWLYIGHDWHWAGADHPPAHRPKWTPPPRPRHIAPPRHKIIARLEHRPGHGPGHGPKWVVHRGERHPEPPRTVTVRPERKEVVIRTEHNAAEVRPERKEVVVRPERNAAEVRPERKEKEKVTVKPDRKREAPPKKDR